MSAKKTDIPAGEPNQCTARTKNCRECGHRYKKGDKTWECPNCGEERRCTNMALDTYTVCRMHGARGGKPPNVKTAIPQRFEKAFNHLAEHPYLWDLADQQIALNLRYSELFNGLDDIEETHLSVDFQAVMKSLNDLEDTLRSLPTKNNAEYKALQNSFKALGKMRDEFMPAYREEVIWAKITHMGEYIRKNYDTTMKHLQADEQMVPIAMVIEVLSVINREALLFITDRQDRKTFNERLRVYFPRSQEHTEPVLNLKAKNK